MAKYEGKLKCGETQNNSVYAAMVESRWRRDPKGRLVRDGRVELLDPKNDIGERQNIGAERAEESCRIARDAEAVAPVP